MFKNVTSTFEDSSQLPPLARGRSAANGAEESSSQWPEFLTGQASRPVRVILIDDDANIRNTMAYELLQDLRCDLIGQAGSVREGKRLILRYEFDVMLVDLKLGDGTGFDLINHMKQVRPMAEAIVISNMEDEQHALRAFELGATGYLIKNSWFGNIPQAVLQVVNGGASITPNLARRLLQRLEQTADKADPVAEHKEKLSEREKAVLKMVAAGHTSGEIGCKLMISSQTVSTHLKNIYRKLQVKTRAQAVMYAAQRGLV